MSGDENVQPRRGLWGEDEVDSSSDESKTKSEDDRVLRKLRLIPSLKLPGNAEISNSKGKGKERVPQKGMSSKFGKIGKNHKGNLATRLLIKKKPKRDFKGKGKKSLHVIENKMSGDQNVQQRWGLRGGDDVDSSSDDSEKTHSEDDHVLIKHKLISSSNFPENEEVSNFQGKEIALPTGTSYSGKSRKKCKENLATKKQPKRDTDREGKQMKNTLNKYKPDPFDNLKLFSNSLIDELKSAREEMFAHVNEEMGIISHVKSVSRPNKKKEIPGEKLGQEKLKEKVEFGRKAPKTNGESSKMPFRSGRAKGSKNSSDAKNAKNQIDPGNNSGISFIPPQGYYWGTQMPEQFPNISQMHVHNMGFNQMGNSSMTCPCHQGLRTGFGFPNQAMENMSRGNDMLGPRIDGGGMRLFAGNNGFSGHY